MRRLQNWFAISGGLFLAAGFYMGLVAAPPDYYQGEVFRIMYIHVPFAESALAAYTALFGASLWYLWKRDPLVDNFCQASAGIGLLFTSVALVTGSIWAKPTWNTWWTWDPKLISFAVLWLILAGYLMLRSFLDDPEKRAVYSAVLAVVGFVDLPIVKFAAEWWRTLHQPLSTSMRGSSIAPSMLYPLIVMSIGFYLLLTYMLIVRTQLIYLQQLLEAKRGRYLSEAHL